MQYYSPWRTQSPIDTLPREAQIISGSKTLLVEANGESEQYGVPGDIHWICVDSDRNMWRGIMVMEAELVDLQSASDYEKREWIARHGMESWQTTSNVWRLTLETVEPPKP